MVAWLKWLWQRGAGSVGKWLRLGLAAWAVGCGNVGLVAWAGGCEGVDLVGYGFYGVGCC